MQEQKIKELIRKGFHIVIWEQDMVCMMDKNGNPAEVMNDGSVIYPEKMV